MRNKRRQRVVEEESHATLAAAMDAIATLDARRLATVNMLLEDRVRAKERIRQINDLLKALGHEDADHHG